MFIGTGGEIGVSTHPMKRWFDSRRSNRNGRFLLPGTLIQTIIKPCFYPRLCQFVMKIVPVINCMCACIRMSANVDNFPREGRGCVYLMVI